MQHNKQSQPHRPPIAMRRSGNPTLRFTSEAWEQLSARRALGNDRVRGFGITTVAAPVTIEEIRFLPRHEVTEPFDDAEVLDFYSRAVERELPMDRYARVWIGSRPGRSARPASVDEVIFARLFGAVPWSVLCLVASSGATHARLRYNVGPAGAWKIPVVIDESQASHFVDPGPCFEAVAPVDVAQDFKPDDGRFRPEEWPVTM